MKLVVGTNGVGSYAFSASSGQVTLVGLDTLSLEQFLLITNVTTNTIVYNPYIDGKGGTLAGAVLSLEYDTAAMADTDDLQIILDYVPVAMPVTSGQSLDANNTKVVTAADAQPNNPWIGTASRTRANGVVGILLSVISPAAIGGSYTFEFGEDGTTWPISITVHVNNLSTIRYRQLLNVGAFYRAKFVPDIALGANVVILTSQFATQDDPPFVVPAGHIFEEADAAFGGQFVFQKAFNLAGQSVNIRGSSESLSNNSETPLVISGVFTGTPEETSQFKSITVFVAADQSGTLQIQFAKKAADFSDLTLVSAVSRSYTAGTAQTFVFSPTAAFYRTVYTNTTTAQTKFRLQTIVHHTAVGPIFSPLNTPLVDGSLAQQARSVMVVKSPTGTGYQNVVGDALGGLPVSAVKRSTYRAAFRTTTVPNTLTVPLTAVTTVQVATIHHTAGSTKKVSIRKIVFRITSVSSGATLVFDLVRLTTAPTGGTVITASKSKSTDAAAEVTCIALPTVAGAVGAIVSGQSLELVTADKNIEVTLQDLQPITDIEAMALLPATLEGYAILCRANGTVTIDGNVNIEFTEE